MRSEPFRKRTHHRIELSYLALFQSRDGDGQGVVLDLSRGGALIGLASGRPALGQATRVRIAPPGGEEVDVPAIVVRHEELAFAVEFPDACDSLGRLLDELGPADQHFLGAATF